MTDEIRPSTTTTDLQVRELIRGAVVHLIGEQPLVADLYGYPLASDTTVILTNVRGVTGKRPVWADHLDSIFYFPWAQIRFVEIPRGRRGERPPSAEDPFRPATADEVVEEPDQEIDEAFLKRIRDV
jgi:hypothetical protein